MWKKKKLTSTVEWSRKERKSKCSNNSHFKTKTKHKNFRSGIVTSDLPPTLEMSKGRKHRQVQVKPQEDYHIAKLELSLSLKQCPHPSPKAESTSIHLPSQEMSFVFL